MSTGPGPATDWLRPDSTVSRMIAGRAKRLSRSAGFSPADFDDIAQELRLAIWRQQYRHDGKRTSFATFADRVVSSRVISLVRMHRTIKRGSGRSPASLDYEPPDKRWVLDQHRTDLKTDLVAALSRTSEELREVANLLTEHSLHATGKHLQRSRRRLHRQRQQLRKTLEDASLRDYLPWADNSGRESRK
jgi:RNA polymerase sigma factor (sigma-70 family)